MEVKKVCILGVGTMGSQIAQLAATTGNPALRALAKTKTYPETGWEALNPHGPSVLPSRWETIPPNSVMRASGQPPREATRVAFEEFASVYEAEFGTPPGVYCDTVYDATMMVLKAIERVGADDAAQIAAEV